MAAEVKQTQDPPRVMLAFQAFRLVVLGFWAAITAMLAQNAHSAPACKVMDPELAASYDGSCVNGLAEGEGGAQGIATYRGGFHRGMKHGFGVKVWPNGDRYAGQFEDDRRHGRGTYFWGERSPWRGERYEGEYRADQRHGIGIYAWPGGDRYEGPWENNRMTGPPTPMQRLRTQALQGAMASLGHEGLRVCQRPFLGSAAKDRIFGVVVGADGQRIRIRIDGTGDNGRTQSGLTIRRGDVIQDGPLDWEPCA